MSAKAKVKGCTHVSSVRAKQTSKRDTDAPAGLEKKGGTTMSEVHLPHQHSDEGTMRELQESVETSIGMGMNFAARNSAAAIRMR